MQIGCQNLDEREEVKALYATLSKVNYVAMHFVRSARDENEAIDRANDLNNRLRDLFKLNLREADECCPPMVWDPITGTCQ